jgi:hypothetical protein
MAALGSGLLMREPHVNPRSTDLAILLASPTATKDPLPKAIPQTAPPATKGFVTTVHVRPESKDLAILALPFPITKTPLPKPIPIID